MGAGVGRHREAEDLDGRSRKPRGAVLLSSRRRWRDWPALYRAIRECLTTSGISRHNRGAMTEGVWWLS